MLISGCPGGRGQNKGGSTLKFVPIAIPACFSAFTTESCASYTLYFGSEAVTSTTRTVFSAPRGRPYAPRGERSGDRPPALRTARTGVVLATKTAETQGKGSVLTTHAAETARQMQGLSNEGSGKHKAKTVSYRACPSSSFLSSADLSTSALSA